MGKKKNRKQRELTEELVKQMRAERKLGAFITDIADKYGIPYNTAYEAITRRTWTHVP